MIKLRLVASFFFLIIMHFSFAQNPEWVNFTNGSWINCMTEEEDTLWVGTKGGLVKLEKSTNTPHFFNRDGIGVFMGNITCLDIDAQGRKIFGTTNGEIIWYDKGNFDTLLTKRNYVGQRPVTALAVDSNNHIWAGFSSALNQFDGTSWVTYALPVTYTTITNIEFDSLGTPFMTTPKGLFKLNGSVLEEVSVPGTFSTNYTSLLFDTAGDLWVSSKPAGSSTGAVIRVRGTESDVFQGNLGNEYYDLFMDDTGKVWVLGAFGYMFFNGSYFETGPYISKITKTMHVDQQGMVWIGTRNGLFKYTSPPKGSQNILINTNNSGLPHNKVTAISQDKTGHMYFASNEVDYIAYSLARLDSTWKIYDQYNSQIPLYPITAINFDQANRVLLGTEHTLYLLENNTWTENYLNAGTYLNINAVMQDSKGEIWFSLPNAGVRRYDGSSWLSYGTHNYTLPSNRIRDMIIDENDHVWVCTDYGLVKFDGNSWIEIGSYLNDFGSITIDKHGNKWMGSLGGLVRYDGATFVKYTKENSAIPGNAVGGVTADTSGNIWMTIHDVGLVKFDGTNWTSYTPYNSGIPFYSSGVFIDKDQNIWLHSENGVAVFREGGVKWPVPPSPYDEFPLGINKANGGEILYGCTGFQLSYKVLSSGSKGVGLYFSPDSGQTWWPPIYKTGGTNRFMQYNWTVPAINSTQCKLKLVDLENPEIYAESYDLFTISYTGGKSLALDTLAKTSYKSGENIEINWEYSNTVTSVNLQYSVNEGRNWTSIALGLANTGNYVWPAPGIEEDSILIRISDASQSCVYDYSPIRFSIQAAPFFTLTSLNEGEPLAAGSMRTIGWKSGFIVSEFVKLEYSTDSGASWKLIVDNELNDGNYFWDIPFDLSDKCLIKITAGSDPSVTDVTNKSFAIVEGSIAILSPAEGTTFYTCINNLVSWTDFASSDNFQLSYSIDDGTTWVTIATVNATTDTKYYNWRPSFSRNVNCLLKITDAVNPFIEAVSAPFAIVNDPPMDITFPNGGEILETGRQYTLSWSPSGSPSRLSVHYSLDDGQTWNTIAGNISNTGSIPWTVPIAFSSQAVIRIKDYYGNCYADESDQVFTIASSLVWPGDIDNNGTADVHDMLPLGLQFGASGSARDSISTLWVGQASADWAASQSNGMNLKFADCDGDGIIDANDRDAVYRNYGYLQNVTYDAQGDPILELGPDLTVVFDKPEYQPGETVHAQVLAGTSTDPVTDLYGVSFKLGFNAGAVVPGSFQMRFDGSFLATSADTLTMAVIQYNEIQAHGSIVRTDQTGISGFGKIADILFVLDENFSGTLGFDISESQGMNAAGAEIAFDHNNDSASVGVIASVGNPSGTGRFVFPNPNTGTFRVHTENMPVDKITLTDMIGNKEHLADLSVIPGGATVRVDPGLKGVFIMKIYCGSEILVEKVIVK